jgi:hypothetical protein
MLELVFFFNILLILAQICLAFFICATTAGKSSSFAVIICHKYLKDDVLDIGTSSIVNFTFGAAC